MPAKDVLVDFYWPAKFGFVNMNMCFIVFKTAYFVLTAFSFIWKINWLLEIGKLAHLKR